MEDILITVVIVASVIWSVVSKLREQKNDTSNKNPNPAPSVNWDEVLRELRHEPIAPEAETVEPEIQEETSVEIEAKTPAPVIEQTPVEELQETEKKEIDNDLNITFADADDLKRAVVYNEILNRKY